jgi:pimeloyl-ACP methyl ester carboxylesterase
MARTTPLRAVVTVAAAALVAPTPVHPQTGSTAMEAEMLPMQAQVGAGMAEAMKETPMYASYKAVAPRPEDFPRLLDRMGELMRTPYDWSDEVKTLAMPVMLVFGDSDMYRPEHIVSFYQLLGGGLKDAGWMREHMSRNRLAILPDLTHYDLLRPRDGGRHFYPRLTGWSCAVDQSPPLRYLPRLLRPGRSFFGGSCPKTAFTAP